MKHNSTYLFPSETKRLLLRPLSLNDAKDWEKWILDPIATKYFPKEFVGKPEHASEWIQRIIDRYQTGRFGFHAIIEKKSNKFIGMCGLLLQEIDGKEELEVGYSFIRKFWGKGYATESAQNFLKLGFEEYKVDSIISIISPDNEASIKVALRNEMTFDKRSTFHGIEVDIYRVNSSNFIPYSYHKKL